MKYDRQKVKAYNMIARKGGPIRIARTVKTPTNPNKPWEGNRTAATTFTHVAVFVPLTEILGDKANPHAQAALIPAHKLPADLKINQETRFTDASGRSWKVVNTVDLDVTGDEPILYTCEVANWAR